MRECRPTTIEEFCSTVKSFEHVFVTGAGTKTALQVPTSDCRVSTLDYSGVVEYEPTEFTITVRAGTKLSDLQSALRDEGQYLPFDPPFADAGATIGGTVCAGLSGPGRCRHGGLRDFILGVLMVDGRGEAIRGGGKVVKNAAGFDLPKLLVGSCGWMGLLTELTIKVFPRPSRQATLVITPNSLNEAIRFLKQLTSAPLDLDALELVVAGAKESQWGECLIRIVGENEALQRHQERMSKLLETDLVRLDEDEAARRWDALQSFDSGSIDRHLVKVPINVKAIEFLDAAVKTLQADIGIEIERRYSMAGNVAWLAWNGSMDAEQLDKAIRPYAGSWLGMLGSLDPVGRMAEGSAPFAHRIKSALDPPDRFQCALQKVY